MKILIIGQAPPAVQQEYPYDTTLLYEIFSWLNIDKKLAQELFEFEAMVDVFPGHSQKRNGHEIPQWFDMEVHYTHTLESKIEKADKILVLGNVAQKALIAFGIMDKGKQVLFMIHPSRRNSYRINFTKEEIITNLRAFLKA